MRIHCLFEQSGTFKNEFLKYGVQAFDYDILNDFGETDFVMDIFGEIEKAFDGEESVFDTFTQDDVIFAFFPCIRFEAQILLSFRGQMHGMEKWTYRQKMMNDMKLMEELHHMYDLVNKLFIVCMDRNLKLIVENPFSEEHFLRRYWCLPPSIIDKDRRENGDHFKKPTQYWFVNHQPLRNLVFEPIGAAMLNSSDLVRQMTGEQAKMLGGRTIHQSRSMISKEYANRFIRQYILPEELWRKEIS